MGGLSPWHLLILVAVLILLFGAKKLPDAARGVGRSLKILKAETKGLRDEDDNDEAEPADAQAVKELPSARAEQPSDAEAKAADLQKQLDELKAQADQSKTT